MFLENRAGRFTGKQPVSRLAFLLDAANERGVFKIVLSCDCINLVLVWDASLGKGFCIGHSYFCGREACTDEWLQMIVTYEILPMLREYWFDEEDKYKLWESLVQGVFL